MLAAGTDRVHIFNSSGNPWSSAAACKSTTHALQVVPMHEIRQIQREVRVCQLPWPRVPADLRLTDRLGM